ncbi:MAG: hypothetical protein IJT02_01110 [Synergistaceae bacterium]|nr:hypothetical protein [Synergistaceae bacterium]
MEERVTSRIDWSRAPADTPVCKDRGVYLRDIVQSILDGYETPSEVMQVLGLTDEDEGYEEIPAIMDIFVPVINAWKSGSCGMGCAGCSGSCGG